MEIITFVGMFTAIAVIFSIISLICSLFALHEAKSMVKYAIEAKIETEAMRKSTHTVQYAPIDPEIDKANQQWATREEVLQKQNKMFQEDLEEEMPELAPDEDDKEIFSF
jgi:biopolymer transport protein ExbB/TolQ